MKTAETNNLVKILEKESEKSLNDIQESLVNNTKLLLSGNETKEREILRELGLDSTHKIMENAKERTLITNKLKERHEDTIYHISDIKKLALDYRLKFLPTSLYKGAIPADLPSILARFYEKEGYVENGKSSYNRSKFRILAPASAFNIKLLNISYQKPIKFDRDPMVFAQVDESGNYWVLLKAWGNDFILKRKILGELFKTTTRVKAIGWFLYFSMLFLNYKFNTLFYNFCCSHVDAKNEVLGQWNFATGASIILIGIVGSIILTIALINWLDEDETSGIHPKPHELASSQIWNEYEN